MIPTSFKRSECRYAFQNPDRSTPRRARATPAKIQGRKMTALEAEEYAIDRSEFDREALYQPLKYHGMSKKHLRLIPYYAWDNRDYGEMRIWFPIAYTV